MTRLDGIDLTPKDVFTALTSLQKVAAQLRSQSDPRAVFADVYGVITRRVAEEIRRGPQTIFCEPAWIARLAGRFAERYFASLDCSLSCAPQSSAAWRLGYSYTAQPTTLPVQAALLGINAHINFDLAQGIYDNIVAHGFVAGDPESERMLARYRHDHDAVNQVLKAALPECLALLAERYECPATRLVLRSSLFCGTLTRVALGMLKSWRDQVWDDVRLQLAMPDAAGQAEVLARMDRHSGALAKAIAMSGKIFGLLGPSPSARRQPMLRPQYSI